MTRSLNDTLTSHKSCWRSRLSDRVCTFPLEALLSQDADQSQELGDLLQVKHCGVVQLYDGQRLFIIRVTVAVVF